MDFYYVKTESINNFVLLVDLKLQFHIDVAENELNK